MLHDLGPATEEQIKEYNKPVDFREQWGGCISTRLCQNCNHLISDSICLCCGVFTCPNCKFENGKELFKLMQEIPVTEIQPFYTDGITLKENLIPTTSNLYGEFPKLNS